jgi:hypothetical protein
MIPYDIDPSLHTGEPESTSLDDGFSPPPHETPEARPDEAPDAAASEPVVDPALWKKSAF